MRLRELRLDGVGSGYRPPVFKSIFSGKVGRSLTPIADSNPFVNKSIVEKKCPSGSPLISITPMMGQKR